MKACLYGHIVTARMLVDEFHANIDIQNNVRDWYCVQLSSYCCDDVDLIVVIYTYLTLLPFLIICWQLAVGMEKVVDIVFFYIAFCCTVFIAPFHLVVISVL